MPDPAPQLEVSSEPKTEEEKRLYEEVNKLNAEVAGLEKVNKVLSENDEVRRLKADIIHTKKELDEVNEKLASTEKQTKAKASELEEIRSKNKTIQEDSIIETLEKELAKMSNQCLKLESECRKKEEEFQKNQVQIKTLRSSKGITTVKSPVFVTSNVSSLLSQAGVGFTVGPVADGHLLAGHFQVDSIDFQGPAASSGIQVGDVLLKIDGAEVSGKEKSFVDSKLKGSEGSRVALEFLRPFGYNQFLDVQASVIRQK